MTFDETRKIAMRISAAFGKKFGEAELVLLAEKFKNIDFEIGKTVAEIFVNSGKNSLPTVAEILAEVRIVAYSRFQNTPELDAPKCTPEQFREGLRLCKIALENSRRKVLA